MNAPDSLKIKINELLDAHWEEILREESFSEIVYDMDYYTPLKIIINKEGKYINIRILPKWGMGIEL